MRIGEWKVDDRTPETQEIELDTPFMGLRVDTGDDWLDFGFFVVLFVIVVAGLILLHRVIRPGG